MNKASIKRKLAANYMGMGVALLFLIVNVQSFGSAFSVLAIIINLAAIFVLYQTIVNLKSKTPTSE